MSADGKKYVLCSTVYVNHERKFLLIHHNKLKKWVPPGGKIESGELPDHAAIRECLEETDLEVELVGAGTEYQLGLVQPQGIEFNHLENHSSHLDFIYFAVPKSFKLSLNHLECSNARWFELEEISKLNTFPSIHHWCQKFSEIDK